jgi:hypothetical protein
MTENLKIFGKFLGTKQTLSQLKNLKWRGLDLDSGTA